jgi:DNA-binding MarR family transcriptional regulator
MTDVNGQTGLTHRELPPLGEAVDFLRLIWAVDHALQRRSRSMAATFGITGPQRLVIRIIGRFPSILASQLAEILHLHPSSLTAVLKRLERRGLIRRRPDQRDRRRWLLGLTRKGLALNGDTSGTVEAAVLQTIGALSKRDLEGARVTLGTLARTLEQMHQPRRDNRRLSRIVSGS